MATLVQRSMDELSLHRLKVEMVEMIDAPFVSDLLGTLRRRVEHLLEEGGYGSGLLLVRYLATVYLTRNRVPVSLWMSCRRSSIDGIWDQVSA